MDSPAGLALYEVGVGHLTLCSFHVRRDVECPEQQGQLSFSTKDGRVSCTARFLWAYESKFEVSTPRWIAPTRLDGVVDEREQ
jgi:hypothetical protein